MWGSGEVLHLGRGGEHVPKSLRPTGEPVAVRRSWFRRRRPGAWSGVGPRFSGTEALPLIRRGALCSDVLRADNGRPNRAVQTVPRGPPSQRDVDEFSPAMKPEQPEFNLLWHHALRLDMEETHLPQKTATQLPSSPDAARRWLAGFPGDHGADHPGAGYTHRKAAAGLHPHHEQHRHPHPPRPVL